MTEEKNVKPLNIDLSLKKNNVDEFFFNLSENPEGFKNKDFRYTLSLIYQLVEDEFEGIFLSPNSPVRNTDFLLINDGTAANPKLSFFVTPTNNFQFYLKKLFLPTGIDGDDPDYNPANEQARQIAEKLKKGNEIRNKLNQEKNSGKVSQSLIGSYTSILSVGMGMDINIFYNYTLFQLYDSFLRYTTKIQYDFYMRVSTMPMMDTSEMKEPNNWLDDLYK